MEIHEGAAEDSGMGVDRPEEEEEPIVPEVAGSGGRL